MRYSAQRKNSILKKTISRLVLLLFLLPVLYLAVALVCGKISINDSEVHLQKKQTIYLSTNGLHLDIVLPADYASSQLTDDLNFTFQDKFLSFGWGDKDFYLNTPEWSDLETKVAFNALFLKSESLVHITRYRNKMEDWVEVQISQEELNKLNNYLYQSFQKDDLGKKILLKDKGYTATDDFYQAYGSYSIFFTCNTWANKAFSDSGLKACLWTPFDFALLDIYN